MLVILVQTCVLPVFSVDFFLFFQAEDGIRAKLVTGVQTCALPILPRRARARRETRWRGQRPRTRASSPGGAARASPARSPGGRRTPRWRTRPARERRAFA